jgi:sugar O-acyltransferase (sialic acid O-acetyltransferase NeuD family)
MSREKLYIIGAGSVGGHVALNIGEYSDGFELCGFLDDDPQKMGIQPFGFDILGTIDDALELKDAAIIIGIAFPNIKQRIIKRLSANGSLVYPSLIHERAWVSEKVTVGQGCIIYPGTTINYGSEIHDFTVVNMNCSLGHHTKVGACSSLAPGVNTGGHTVIGKSVDMGIGVSTLQNIQIGKGSTVGGQSMLIEDVSPASTVAGVPGKVIS